jgi:hypothetical protein
MNNDDLWRWKELKAKFLREFTPSEQLYFLKKAKESVAQKGYPVSEDLFNYCYFVTLKERLHGMSAGSQGGEGYMRFLLVETSRDIEKEVRYYEGRLEQKKPAAPGTTDCRLIEYLSR